MKLTIKGTGLSTRRADAILLALWDISDPEQLGTCSDAYEKDWRELQSLVGHPFTMDIAVAPLSLDEHVS